MGTVKNLTATVLKNGSFWIWDKVLRHIPAPPGGFTQYYLWKPESEGGAGARPSTSGWKHSSATSVRSARGT